MNRDLGICFINTDLSEIELFRKICKEEGYNFLGCQKNTEELDVAIQEIRPDLLVFFKFQIKEIIKYKEFSILLILPENIKSKEKPVVKELKNIHFLRGPFEYESFVEAVRLIDLNIYIERAGNNFCVKKMPEINTYQVLLNCESLPLGVCMANLKDLKIIAVNPNLCKLLNYTKAELLEKTVFQLFPDESRKEWTGLLFEQVKHQHNFIEAVGMLGNSGKVLLADIHIWITVIKDNYYILLYFQEVTKKIRYQTQLAFKNNRFSSIIKELKQSKTDAQTREAEFRDIIEHASDGIIILQNGKIKLYNLRFIKILKESLDLDVKNCSFKQFVRASDFELLSQLQFKDSSASMLEIPLLNSRSEIIETEISISNVVYQGEASMLFIIRDIAERKAILKQVENLAKFPEENPSLVLRFDGKGHILYANPVSKLVLKTFSEDGFNLNSKWLKITKYYLDHRQEALLEVVLKQKIYALNIVPVANHNYVNVYGTDITEVKATKEKQLHLEQQLLQSKKLESIGTLSAGIAHEINTPLQFVGDNLHFLKQSFNSIIESFKSLQNLSFLADLKKEYVNEINEIYTDNDLDFLLKEIPDAVDQSKEGIDRVNKIVRAMKDFSHRGSEEERAVSSINEAISSTAVISKNEWKYAAEIKENLAPDLPLISCYIGEIKQVILNMIINAAQAIKEIQKGSELGLITIGTSFDKDNIYIEIEDTGPGISEVNMERIFDPFFTTKPVGVGSGQGLAISYAIIKKRHGGTIIVNSKLGMGTRFIISLPINQVEE